MRLPIVHGLVARDDEHLILEIPMLPRPDHGFTRSSHYGGAIRFGSDGLVYLGIGDSYCFHCPQRLSSLFGKIIRIDIRGSSIDAPYRVPDDNPFVGQADARPEIWAHGLRNPWRMAFDPHDGRLWLGDAGHEGDEEISIAVAGANLGWPAFEGAACLEIDDSVRHHYGDGLAGYACGDLAHAVMPIHTYASSGATCAVIGGAVYRGETIQWLAGAYIFGDFCSGQVWALTGDDQAGWRRIEIADLPRPISTFGVDTADDLYVATFGGPLLRLIDVPAGGAPTVSIMPAATRASGRS